MDSIYGLYADVLPKVMDVVVNKLKAHDREVRAQTGEGAYEHLLCRIKADDSMRQKLYQRGLPMTPESALTRAHDSIGLRVVTRFVDDVYDIVGFLDTCPGLTVITKKDYIRQAKPNGYRSYHLIVEVEVPYEDVLGRFPGQYLVEIQLRTIAMDTWASLEHQLKYKRSIKNEKIVVGELKRVADELASCDVSMQTIRNLIRSAGEDVGTLEAVAADDADAGDVPAGEDA